MYNVMCEPVELCAPLEFEALVNLPSEMFLCLFICPPQNKHISQVFQILHILELRNTSTLHLRGEGGDNIM